MANAEFIKVLSNVRSLRAATADISFEQLQEMSNKLAQLVEDRRVNFEREQQENAAREAKINQYLEMMKADGIDVTELTGGAVVATSAKAAKGERSARAKRPPKYRYTDADGQEQTWTGQGRQPLPIRTAIEQEGKTLADFLIEPEQGE